MNRHAVGGFAAALLAVSGAVGGLSAADAVGAGGHTANSVARPQVSPAKERAHQLATARERADAVRTALGLPAQQRLVVKDVIRDASGATHVRYDRTFRGLPVVGGDLVVHFAPSGKRSGATWNGARSIDVSSIRPSISPTKASDRATTAFRRQGATKDDQGSRLVVFSAGKRPVLAYDVLTQGVRDDGVPSRLHTIVNAHTGAVLASFDEVQTGEGHGIFVGDVTIGTQAHTGGGYEIRDSHGNYATDVHNQGDPNTGVGPAGDIFVDADNVWGNGSNSDRASAAVDAQYGAEKTYDFYNNVLGRAGIWNNGTGARSRVHFANQMVNAFWDGTQMSYGDGAGNNAPLVELDVAGHEMSHGVTENTAGLVYSGEAGGLNEATSDIFGTSVEFYTNNPSDVPDYLIGEEININGNGTPLRYMDKPSKDGLSRDCWSSTLGNLNPHYSSGPLNHWYYLASEGSGAKTINGVSYNSPTCNSTTVTGIGRDKVEKIWYRTLSVYLTSTSNYAAARNGAIKSAKDLYPSDATVCQGIAAAFSAISVAAGSETCTTTPPGGGQCTGTLTYNGSLTAGQSTNLASFSDSTAGTLKVCLDGPTGADFDVYLQKLSGSSTWTTVAQGITSSPDESFSYNNSAGTYRLRVTAYSGSGSFKASVSE